jgi:hypothetical protein
LLTIARFGPLGFLLGGIGGLLYGAARRKPSNA